MKNMKGMKNGVDFAVFASGERFWLFACPVEPRRAIPLGEITRRGKI